MPCTGRTADCGPLALNACDIIPVFVDSLNANPMQALAMSRGHSSCLQAHLVCHSARLGLPHAASAERKIQGGGLTCRGERTRHRTCAFWACTPCRWTCPVQLAWQGDPGVPQEECYVMLRALYLADVMPRWQWAECRLAKRFDSANQLLDES